MRRLLGSLGDPRFADAANGDYRLASSSGAIDNCSSQPTAGLGSIDADGNPRVENTLVDCGAFEFVPPPEELLFLNGFEE